MSNIIPMSHIMNYSTKHNTCVTHIYKKIFQKKQKNAVIRLKKIQFYYIIKIANINMQK